MYVCETLEEQVAVMRSFGQSTLFSVIFKNSENTGLLNRNILYLSMLFMVIIMEQIL